MMCHFKKTATLREAGGSLIEIMPTRRRGGPWYEGTSQLSQAGSA